MKTLLMVATLAIASTVNVADSDPYLWLENVTGDKALTWVKERSTLTAGRLASDQEFDNIESRILAILDADDRIPGVYKAGEYFYNFWRDRRNPRGLWRRTTLEEYRTANPKWEVVLDLDRIAEQEEENWVFKGASILTTTYDKALVNLSRGGADAIVVREFDLTSKDFIADGFALPEAKTRVSWAGPDSILVGTNFGPGSMTDSGYPRVAKRWTRGQSLAEAPTLFEGETTDVSIMAFADLSPGYENEFLVRSTDFYNRLFYVRRNGEWVLVDTPTDARLGVHRGYLFINLKSDWTVGGSSYQRGTLLVTDFEAFLEGERSFDVLFEPTSNRALVSYGNTRNHVLITERENITNRIYVATPTRDGWSREPLMGADSLSTINVSPVDSNVSDDYFAVTTNFVTPRTTSMHTIGSDAVHFQKSDSSRFNSNGVEVAQHWTISNDGTRIPYFQVGRKVPTTTPTLLTGYGGFELSRTPAYNPLVGANWLERGNVYVVANIRGGGEFGPAWHQAAVKENRPRAFEDFIAVAEDLIRRKVTTPAQLGIQGGSNGGLLVGNMLTMRPDLFGAIVCQVPLLDMRRYHKLLAGASWMAEYGDPDNPEEWEFIRGFSPYHNVEKSADYPPLLITTSTRDDRVHPGHARKMTAKMGDMGHQVFYYENTEGGHGGAADNSQRAFMSALAYKFLREVLEH